MSEEGDFFKKNLSILEKVEPGLVKRLKEAKAGERIKVLPSKMGPKVARVKNDLGQERAMASLVDPLKEAERLIERFDFSGKQRIAILGFGFGYHLLAALEQLEESASLTVVEPDLLLFKEAVRWVDLSPLFKRGVRLIIGRPLVRTLKEIEEADLFIDHPATALLCLASFDPLFSLLRSLLLVNWSDLPCSPAFQYRLTGRAPDPGKILLVQLSSIGDVAYATPVIRGLRERYPKARLYFLVEEAASEVVTGNPCLEEVIVFEAEKFRRGLRSKESLLKIGGEMLCFANYLKEKGFDLVINLHTSPRSAYLSYLACAKETEGLSIEDNRPIILGNSWMQYKHLVTMNEKAVSFGGLSRVELNLKMAGVSPCRRELSVFVGQKESDWARRQADGLLIGLGIGSRYETRCWGIERFAKIADILSKACPRLRSGKGAKIILFGGKDDLRRAEEIERKAGSSLLNLTGKTTLNEAAALLKECQLFITNDTGLMHIAAAVKTPCLVIGGYSEHGPYGREGHLVVAADIPCKGCMLPQCEKMDCMKLITPELVLRAIKLQEDLKRGKTREANPRSESRTRFEKINLYYSGRDRPGPFFSYLEPGKKKDVFGELLRFCHLRLWERKNCLKESDLGWEEMEKELKRHCGELDKDELREQIEKAVLFLKELEGILKEGSDHLKGLQREDTGWIKRVSERVKEDEKRMSSFGNISHLLDYLWVDLPPLEEEDEATRLFKETLRLYEQKKEALGYLQGLLKEL
ncbi:glycosyltransferase family 9 protein [bacterium]|nr:glycosyltransferase family 9 protein [bacterium]